MSTQDKSAALRDRRVARVIDREIAPIWHDRFARLIIRNLPSRTGQFVLDIECGPGRLTTEILQRTDRTTRVLALESSPSLIELAKSRVRPEWKRRVYHKPGTFDDIMAMGDATYDLTLANLVLNETHDIGSAISEMRRITRPGGRVMATMPLHGSWEEVEDIFAEVLRDAGLKDAARRLKRFRSVRPTPESLASTLQTLGVERSDFVIEHERLQLLFPSGREFLFAPLIEHGPLRLWKAIIGKEGSAAELFWKLKEAIDTYYQGHVLAVTLVAGLIHIGKPDPAANQPSLTSEFWQHYPQLDALWGRLATGGASSPFDGFGDDDLDDFDIDFEDSEPTPAAPEPQPEPEPEPEPVSQPEPAGEPKSRESSYEPYLLVDKELPRPNFSSLPTIVDDDDDGATAMFKPVQAQTPAARPSEKPADVPTSRPRVATPVPEKPVDAPKPRISTPKPRAKPRSGGLPVGKPRGSGLPRGGLPIGKKRRSGVGIPAFKPPPKGDAQRPATGEQPVRNRPGKKPPPAPRKSGTVPVFRPPTDKKK